MGIERPLRLFCAGLFVCGAACVSGITAGQPVEIIAHRGASFDAPENTLASVKLAWRRKAPAVEVDIYMSSDEHLVVYHDKTTKRIGGRDQSITSQSLEQLRQLDVGGWKAPEYKGERIPTLDEVLRTVPRKGRVFIEVKDSVRVVPHLVRLLRSWKQASKSAVVIAFSFDVVEATKKAMPDLPVYWLVNFKRESASEPWQPDFDTVLHKAIDAGLDGLNINHSEMITSVLVEQAHAAGLGFYVWTVNEPMDAERLVLAGVDGITTDRPRWLVEQIGRSDDEAR